MKDKSDAYYKAIIARRDARFDGRFYFGVKTTGIYCRPVCPARPKPENMVVFKSASEAEKAGFRACLRCHPDLAPGHRLHDRTSLVVGQALQLLQEAPDDNFSIQHLAQTLRLTDRHLRRLFDQHLGVSPLDILITRRLHFAKQMIRETRITLTDIAFTVGFKSIRRFNEAFKDRYHRSPSSFRQSGKDVPSDGLTLSIPIHLPYDWKTVLAYLHRHEAFGIEQVIGQRYRRFVIYAKKVGSVSVAHWPQESSLQAQFVDVPLTQVRGILARLKNLLDTDHNPRHLPVIPKFPTQGIRVPGSFDPFETAVSIILSQLVSTEQAKLALKKLIVRFGQKVAVREGVEVYRFPSAKTLATSRVDTIGLPKARGRAIRELAKKVADRSLRFDAYTDLETVKRDLLAIHGIGPWTAEMIAMRCFGDADAFPQFDLILKRALDRKSVDPSVWTASRAYLTHCLWRDSKKGD